MYIYIHICIYIYIYITLGHAVAAGGDAPELRGPGLRDAPLGGRGPLYIYIYICIHIYIYIYR